MKILHFKYKQAKSKSLVQLKVLNGEVLTIPIDVIYKVEVSNGKTIVHCKNVEVNV